MTNEQHAAEERRHRFAVEKCETPQYFPAAALAFDGTVGWRRMEFRFKTSGEAIPGRVPRVWFVMRHTTGSAWIDQVELTEIGPSGGTK